MHLLWIYERSKYYIKNNNQEMILNDLDKAFKSQIIEK